MKSPQTKFSVHTMRELEIDRYIGKKLNCFCSLTNYPVHITRLGYIFSPPDNSHKEREKPKPESNDNLQKTNYNWTITSISTLL